MQSVITGDVPLVRSAGLYIEYSTPYSNSNICLLGVILPRVYPLPRRVKYTRVYTTVYLRVYNCVHACTQPRSRYVPDRALSYADLPRLTLGAPEIRVRLPWIWSKPPKGTRGACRYIACVSPASELYWVLLSRMLMLSSSLHEGGLVREGGRDFPYNMVYVLWRRTSVGDLCCARCYSEFAC